ncbi:hypothetical protein [Thiomicrorhabdus cannonii]|uniref:hypothetical protein n=1 Tax=Thiomicrorhabdus cannonii TaxID=2748011 RepID=UPI0015BC940D|nr:hypothetical protein [Thiomicrorhabdus cannonii]
MEGTFTLENLKEKMKPDRFYRLDLVSGIYLDTKYEPDMIFKALSASFSEYSDWYQQDLNRIKAIAINDRFKSHSKGNNQPIISTQSGSSFSIPIDITNQFFMKPGIVWRNGEIVWMPKDSISLSLNTKEQAITSFRELSKKISNLPFIKDSFSSNLIELHDCEVMVNGSNIKTTVFLPVMEVVRYYFSGSRHFTTMFYNGGMEAHRIEDEFIYKSNFDPLAKNVYLWLRRKCKDSDAILLARAIADRQAMKAMKNVYASIVDLLNWRNRQNKRHNLICCPKTELPFIGIAEIEVQGQWLPPDNDGRFGFLIRSIDKCHNPFPFESLEVESVDSFRSSGKPSGKPPKPKPPRRKDKQKPNLTHDERPNENLPENELKFYLERFAGLNDVKVKKITQKSKKDMQIYIEQENEKEEAANKGSTLPGKYGKGNKTEPWDVGIHDEENGDVSDRLSATAAVIHKIVSGKSEYSVRALPSDLVDDSQPFGFYSFQRPVGKNMNYDWCYVGRRRRKALFLELSTSARRLYVLEIEDRNGVGFSLYILSGGEFKPDDAGQMLQKIASVSANNISKDVFKRCFSHIGTMKHVTNSDESLEVRLSGMIDKALL